MGSHNIIMECSRNYAESLIFKCNYQHLFIILWSPWRCLMLWWKVSNIVIPLSSTRRPPTVHKEPRSKVWFWVVINICFIPPQSHWISLKASNVNSKITYLNNNKFWVIADSHHFHLQFTWISQIFGQATLSNIPFLASTVTDPGVVTNYTIGAWQILYWWIQFGSRNVACHKTIRLNYMAKLMWHTNKSRLNMQSVEVWTCLGTTVLCVKISPKLNTSSWLVDY